MGRITRIIIPNPSNGLDAFDLHVVLSFDLRSRRNGQNRIDDIGHGLRDRPNAKRDDHDIDQNGQLLMSHTPVILIGISGKKGAGKDTLARLLCEHLPRQAVGHSPIQVVRRSLADQLKDEVFEVFRHTGVPVERADFDHPEKKLPHRQLLQVWGTEVRRNLCGSDYWLRALERYLEEQARYVHTKGGALVCIVPDIRFPNEADLCTGNSCRLGGYRPGLLIRVEDFGRVPTDTHSTHSSETSLDDYRFPIYIDNSGTESEFEDRVRTTLIPYVRQRLTQIARDEPFIGLERMF